jgi:hypothetical protein
MTPFAVAIILIVSSLFIVLSLAPLLNGRKESDSFEPSTQPRTKVAH